MLRGFLTGIAGLLCWLMVSGCGMTGGGAAAPRGEAAYLLNRPGLVVTEEEYQRAVAKEQARRERFDALAKAQANVELYDAERERVLAMRQAQLQAYQEQEQAKIDAVEQAKRDQRRAQVGALSESVAPVYEQLRQQEAAYKEDAEAVRLRRGLK